VTLSFSPEAEEDLVAIVSYLAERNPNAARELGQ
jgi:plasmid stabilization system protein ParE